MRLTSMLEVLWASHLTFRVRSRFTSRGGIFLVAPPGNLKTTILSQLQTQIGVNAYSDMVTNDLAEARDLIAGNKVTTLVFYDFNKLYERRSDTAANIVGNLRQVADEGFCMTTIERGTSGGRQPIQRLARALVLGGMTPDFYREHLGAWRKGGFARRFLWAVYQLKFPHVIVESILREMPIVFNLRAIGVPANLEIEMELSQSDEIFLLDALRYQEDLEVPLILMKKILAVLRWKYRQCGSTAAQSDDQAFEVLAEFAESLGKEGADLTIDDGEQRFLDFAKAAELQQQQKPNVRRFL